MMKNEFDYDAPIIAQSGFGAIQRCRCEGYHLSLRNVHLHFTRAEFIALGDLFRQAEYREDWVGGEDRTRSQGFLV